MESATESGTPKDFETVKKLAYRLAAYLQPNNSNGNYRTRVESAYGLNERPYTVMATVEVRNKVVGIKIGGWTPVSVDLYNSDYGANLTDGTVRMQSESARAAEDVSQRLKEFFGSSLERIMVDSPGGEREEAFQQSFW